MHMDANAAASSLTLDCLLCPGIIISLCQAEGTQQRSSKAPAGEEEEEGNDVDMVSDQGLTQVQQQHRQQQQWQLSFMQEAAASAVGLSPEQLQHMAGLDWSKLLPKPEASSQQAAPQYQQSPSLRRAMHSPTIMITAVSPVGSSGLSLLADAAAAAQAGAPSAAGAGTAQTSGAGADAVAGTAAGQVTEGAASAADAPAADGGSGAVAAAGEDVVMTEADEGPEGAARAASGASPMVQDDEDDGWVSSRSRQEQQAGSIEARRAAAGASAAADAPAGRTDEHQDGAQEEMDVDQPSVAVPAAADLAQAVSAECDASAGPRDAIHRPAVSSEMQQEGVLNLSAQPRGTGQTQDAAATSPDQPATDITSTDQKPSPQQHLQQQVQQLNACKAAILAVRRQHQQQLKGITAGAAAAGPAVEPPDEFLDPITAVMMRDPVKLPDSGMVLDRQTVVRHLVSSDTDPFTRTKLEMGMVAAEVQLRSRIQEWCAQHGQ